ncbi:MAG: IS5/IS1182 family transposase, partial [Cyanobacteria bacterium QH_10_48_56]
YGREYRTYFHIAKSWGLHESTADRTIRQVEDLLIHSGVFTLPGKKQLQASEHQIEVVMVDVTETPIERPKKNKSASTLAKRNGTH